MSSSSSYGLMILQGPSSRNAVIGLGYPELFSVTAWSPLAISYKWQHSVDGGLNYFDINPDGGVFTGSRTSVLGVNAGMTDFSSVWNGAHFRCVVESGGQTLVSSAASLTVKDQTCNGVVECGGSMYSADCGLLPMPGYNQYMDCTDCKCVSVALASSSSSEFQSENSSSSSSSEYYTTFEYTGFLEIRVPRRAGSSSSSQQDQSSSSSSDSSELLTFMNKDPQNLLRIQTIDQEEIKTNCYYLAFDEPCPQGYQFEEFLNDCEEPPCDKICCPESRDGYDAMICGRAYSGSMDYNRPWQFHIDPESLSLKQRREVEYGSLVEAAPSEIERLLAEGSIQEGTTCCFMVKGSIRDMRLVGEDYCFDPLHLSAVRVFDETFGEFVQETSCEGDCTKISGPFCLDGYAEEFSNQLDAEIEQIELQVTNMTEQEGVEYHVAGLEGSEYSERFLYHMLQFEDLDQGFATFNASSSSSYDEMDTIRLSFDRNNDSVSANPAAPALFQVAGGVNYVFSIVGGGSDNYFSFSVPAGYALYELDLSPNSGSGSMAIQAGQSWDGLSTLEEVVFGLGESVSLGSSLPLGQGQYTLRVSTADSEFTYILALTLGPSGGP